MTSDLDQSAGGSVNERGDKSVAYFLGGLMLITISATILLSLTAKSSLAQFQPLRWRAASNRQQSAPPARQVQNNYARQPVFPFRQYCIGAWYFTPWSSANQDIHPRDSLKTYHRWDAWGGVRDHALGADPWQIRQDYSDRRPAIGFYDQMYQDVMESHIRQAATAGLSYFAFYWYWDKDQNCESSITVPIHTYLRARSKANMKFLIAPIALGQNEMTLSAWSSSVVPSMLQYICDESYMRTSDGRPIVMDFNTGFNGPGKAPEHAQALVVLRNAVKRRLGVEPFILAIAQRNQTGQSLNYPFHHLPIDGFAYFDIPPTKPAEPYSQTNDDMVRIMASRQMPIFVPCGSAGVDARPWFHVGWGWGNKWPTIDGRPYNLGLSADEFRRQLENIKQYIDAQPAKTLRMMTIYAWNEWGEGGIIEPRRVSGNDWLSQVSQVFGLTPRDNWRPDFSDDAVWISTNAPEVVKPGASVGIEVVMRNTGKCAWTGQDHYKLGSCLCNPAVYGESRAMLPPGVSVQPEQNHGFHMTVIAPKQTGEWMIETRMVRDNSKWFGDFSPPIRIRVE